jgi:GDP-L-fucose synthase
MNQNDKIYVAGHRGLVGSAVLHRLQSSGFHNLVVRSHEELDLMDESAVAAFFAAERPRHVVLAAARVGGILANSIYSAEFIRENLLIQTNVIHQAYVHQVESLLFLGSSCIYPRDCPQPIREEYFMTGPLEKTNSAYAVAKIAGVEMCHAYNRQYGTRYLCVMPTNLYGTTDNFDPETSHVLPAMLRKFHEGKLSGRPVVLWGTGTPRREFLHVDDMADACLHIMTTPPDRLEFLFQPDTPPLINIGCGEDLTIMELAELVAGITGYEGPVQWDRSKPDGTLRKLLDISRLQHLGWSPRIPLQQGIRQVYEWFQEAAIARQ